MISGQEEIVRVALGLLLVLLLGCESERGSGTDCRIVAAIVSLEDGWQVLEAQHPHEARIAKYISDNSNNYEYAEVYVTCRRDFH